MYSGGICLFGGVSRFVFSIMESDMNLHDEQIPRGRHARPPRETDRDACGAKAEVGERFGASPSPSRESMPESPHVSSAYGSVPPIYTPSDSWDEGDSAAAGIPQSFQEYSRANYGRQMMSSRNRGRRRLWTVVLVAASIVLVVCLAILGVIAWGYYSGTKAYDEVAQSANVVTEANALAEMTVDWDALLAQNPDTVAWIYMPGTSIDYPVVQGDSDEEYLKKDFTGSQGGIVSKGAIFLSTVNSPDFSNDNNFIYGHNMNDNTMFAHLVAMEDQATFDQSRTFYVLTPSRNYRCTTLALDVVASTETSIIQPDFMDSASMANYVQERMDAASAKATDADLASITKLFTLITCGDDYAATRAVLFGGVVETAVPANADASADQGEGESGDASSDGGASSGGETSGDNAESVDQPE